MRSTRHNRTSSERGSNSATARGRRTLVAGMLVAVSLWSIPSGWASAQGVANDLAPQAHVESKSVDGAPVAGRVTEFYREDASLDDAKAARSRPEWIEEALSLSIARIDRDDVKGPRKLRGADKDLKLHSALKDDLGETHLRLAQMHDGVEVFGGQLVSHVKDGAEPEIGGRTFDVVDVDTRPVLDAAQAIEAAKTAHELSGRLSAEPTAELLILPHEVFDYAAEGEATLCWRVRLRVEGQAHASGNFDYYVDAKDGHIVWRHAADQRGSGTSFYSGNVAIPSVLSGGKYYMTDTGRGSSKVFDMSGASSGAGSQLWDANDVWADSALFGYQKAGVDAQYGVARSWDYFLNTYGWRGMDGAGGAVTCKVHWDNPDGIGGAMNDGTALLFDDDNGTTMGPWVSIDVVAHEFTHGVTGSTAGLIYMNESGAINESFSDIFGTAVEWYVGNLITFVPDYLLFEDVYRIYSSTGRDAGRDMANPTRLNEPAYNPYVVGGITWLNGRDHYGNRYTGTLDNGGVHVNSGIMNNAFYLMSVGGTHRSSGIAVPAIGRQSAERIFYRALSAYLFPSAKFFDARIATVNAAADLFGPASAEVVAVEKAWDAVGVGGPNLFFYNDDSGAAATAKISNGAFSQMVGWGNGAFALSWTDIVPTRQGLFFYNRYTGAYAVARTEMSGALTTLSGGYLPNNYPTVVSADNGILLYRSSDGSGMVIQVTATGSVVVRQTFPTGSFAYWSSVISTPGGLFFYNKSTGTIAVCRIGANGSWTQTDARYNYVGRNYDTVMAIGPEVLLYDRWSGTYELGKVADGRYSMISNWACSQTIGAGYQKIVKHGGDIFFYNPDTGQARVTRRGFCGLQIAADYPAYSFGLYWSHLVSTGDGLFFYREDTGAAAVGGFNANGSFYQTAGYGPGSFGLYWSHVMRITK